MRTLHASTPAEAVAEVVELVRHKMRNEQGLAALLKDDDSPEAWRERVLAEHAAKVLAALVKEIEGATIAPAAAVAPERSK